MMLLRKFFLMGLSFVLALVFVALLAACQQDTNTVKRGDNPEAQVLINECWNNHGFPIMHSADGYLYVYCAQGR